MTRGLAYFASAIIAAQGAVYGFVGSKLDNPWLVVCGALCVTIAAVFIVTLLRRG